MDKYSTNTLSTMTNKSQLLLPLSVFLFKFLEWWYSNENLISPPQKDPIPPPPAPPEIITTSSKASHNQKTEAISLPQDRATCPLCNRKRVNPACVARSEEHTSELQSLMRISYAVFCFKK